MPKINTKTSFDLDEFDPLRGRGTRPGRKPPLQRMRRSHAAALDEILQHNDHAVLGSEEEFTPSFTSSRHEREWILEYLTPFYEFGFISDVLFKVKGGKEANVYCCSGHPSSSLDLVAAKVYRPRMFRNLRNDVRYRQGRAYLDAYGKPIEDDGALHAIRKGTRIGKEMQHDSWLAHEYNTLQLLFEAGVDVPKPISMGQNTILMEYLGDADQPAPTLLEVELEPTEARRLCDRLMHNVEVMLACHRIHGDLSAYNVLYWEGEIHIIDFPQAVDPRSNREAYDIFQRDVERLCQYFNRYHLNLNARTLTHHMWEKYCLQNTLPYEDEAEALLLQQDGFDPASKS
jgi:RIO kinase 1